jgi:exodeoxyribonuclease V alpha subunit
MIDVMELITGRGFPKRAAKEAIKTWGNLAASVIRQNPFALMRFRGCGFKLTDALYLTLGHSPTKAKRQALCAWHGIASNTTGHTWFYQDVASAALRSSIGGAEVNEEKAIRLATKGGLLAVTYTDGPNGEIDPLLGTCCWLAESRKAANERRVAKYVAEAMVDTAWDMLIDDLEEISIHQLDQLHAALDPGAQIAILGGSPGTGKTFTAAQFIKRIVLVFGAQHICIAAPTGKAAVRISEAMQSYGVRLKARTIHSLLGVERGDNGDGWTFRHNRSNPLPYRFIIIDESSMIDTDLMASLLAARHRDASILFVGDVNQLPPVGHGAPLRDFIAAGLPYGELREIRRNSGMIVEACAAIRDEQPWKALGRGERDRDDPTQNLVCIGGSSADEQVELLKRGLLAMNKTGSVAEMEHVDPVWDCQVLVAVNKRSKLSRRELNPVLQDLLNNNPKVPGWPFRVADKVVCLSNGFYSVEKKWGSTKEALAAGVNERGEVYVANGECGKVLSVADAAVVVELDSPRRRVLVRKSKAKEAANDGGGGGGNGGESDADGDGSKGLVGNWDLAYALSVHRAQGSEWPVVFVVLDEYPGAARICDRSWFYTATSRAKKLCVLVGNDGTARKFCKSNAISKRKTFLKELITDAIPTQEVSHPDDSLHPSPAGSKPASTLV